MSKPQYELAQIIRDYGEDFSKKHAPLKQHLSVLNAIQTCRTAALGGHMEQCDNCSYLRISYNSCRNRHCPKCQSISRERWIAAHTYFHVVFTLPQELNLYCLKHPAALYNLLFQSSKETIETFATDPRHLGASAGMISVLHTWGQNLSLHPHVHMIVPGGGFNAAGCWKPSKHRGTFLFPVKAMSKVFKHKFMEGLLKWLPTTTETISKNVRETLYSKDWVVYAKRPFGGPKQVIEYLGRYTHKVAISNHRIKSIENGKVRFGYKDYADNSQQKDMTLDATEFLRRFCLHLLPKGFRKMRHYGFLSNRNAATLGMQQMQMGIIPPPKQKVKKEWKEVAKEKLHCDVDVCPCCKTGRMVTILAFEAHGPPAWAVNKYNQQQAAAKNT
jgi:Putative transposase/Transposase zinc-binding domain